MGSALLISRSNILILATLIGTLWASLSILDPEGMMSAGAISAITSLLATASIFAVVRTIHVLAWMYADFYEHHYGYELQNNSTQL